MNEKEKEQYWKLVETCLTQFFQYNEADAIKASLDLRKQVGGKPADDIFYHAEPLDIACDIAQAEIDREVAWPEYTKLLEKGF